MNANCNPVERRGKGGKERNSKGSQKNSKSLQTNNAGLGDAAGLRNSGQLPPEDAAPEAQIAGHDAALALPPPRCLSCSSELLEGSEWSEGHQQRRMPSE
ncbi:hypothetical protein TIFTF001_039380 [Ficus carica]|uniref:Uncharacterized protein n=1 Tax=Ficus carica TaxID=3494 RepID=A0AA88EER4_FICCA|nr:hypothetical protein TIFTF001_039380 [Ficus carica]